MMKTEAESQVMLHDIKILIVGNNPIELSHVFKNLSEVQGSKLVTEIAFDFKTIRERLSTFVPNFIFIDDNIGKMELKHVIDSLAKRKTKGIPITILKSSNYQESAISGVMNFLLKDTLTTDTLYKSFIQSLRFKKTNEFLALAYKKRKRQLIDLLKS